MAVLGNRWAAGLLVAAFLGTSRFTDFQTQLGVPPSLLTERLQTFCDIGVLTAAPAGDSERSAYRLSGKGRALAGVLVTALQWAQRWFVAPEGPAIVLRHRGCGQALTGELACDRCGDRLSGAQVDVTQAEVAGIP
jgi:DNA-binding HxlR family transcriptional regulator